MTIETPWGGSCRIERPSLQRLFTQSPLLKRLEKIDQSGPLTYYRLAPRWSRLDHSVGVFALLQQAKAPLSEQVAGLFHDASHSAFSHVADHLLDESPNQEHSYQDKNHLYFLQRLGALPLVHELGNLGLKIADLNPDLPIYTALERPHPELCADRIEYIIHTGLLWGKITKEEAGAIVNSLVFDEQTWCFKEVESALIFANLSLFFTKNLWGAPWNFAVYEYFADILRSGMESGLISEDDFRTHLQS